MDERMSRRYVLLTSEPIYGWKRGARKNEAFVLLFSAARRTVGTRFNWLCWSPTVRSSHTQPVVAHSCGALAVRTALVCTDHLEGVRRPQNYYD